MKICYNLLNILTLFSVKYILLTHSQRINIREKYEQISKTVAYSQKESTTVTACVSANGNTNPPLIICPVERFQLTWKSTKVIP